MYMFSFNRDNISVDLVHGSSICNNQVDFL
jgi:hypothetical protein